MPRRSLPALLALALLPAVTVAQLPPQKALEALVVAPDLQVELFAVEPMLVNPTSIDVDHLGRVWVCEAVNYRRVLFNRPILRPEGDRIVILTDKDGDGKADDSTVFYQGKEIYGPIGIAVAPLAGGKPGACKVFVCQSPDILLFEDLDGDGKADGPPKKFLTGFRGFDHDHGVHGINIGPDGKLYFTVGDSGVDGLTSSDGKGRVWKSNSTDCRAGTVWRCDIDGKDLELIAHNFRNNYECCVNSFGEIWLSDNDDDGNQQTRICFVMPGGDYGYHPRGPGQSHWHEEQPGVVHKVLRTGFGSPTGICFYEGSLLPKRFHGQLLHTDAGPREFRAFHIKPKGAGYEAQKEVLVSSEKDSWFRLSDVCVAPDGSVFLADWYDPGVGGHGMGDWTRGRIYRVTPKGHKGYKVPEVRLETVSEILDALGSPCLATRALAIAKIQNPPEGLDPGQLQSKAHKRKPLLLMARANYAVWPFLAKKLAKDVPEEHRTETSSGLLLLDVTIEFSREDLFRLMPAWIRIDHDIIRRPLSKNSFKIEGSEPREKIANKMQIAREAVLYLRDQDVQMVREVFYEVAKEYDGHDHFYRAALNIACGTDPARRDAILADFDKHFPEWNDKVADLVWELRPRSVLPRLEKLLADPTLTARQKGRIVDIIAVNDDPDAGKSLLMLLRAEQPAEVKNRALDNLRLFLPGKWIGLTKGDDLQVVIGQMLRDERTAVVGLQLVAAAGHAPALEDVDRIIANDMRPLELRRLGVRTLGKLNHPKAAQSLSAVIMFSRAPELQTEAVLALGEQITGRGDAPAAKEALQVLQQLVNGNMDHELKRAAVSALAGSRIGTDWLLKLKEDGKMPEAVAAEAGKLLRNSPFQGQRNKALILFPAPGKLDPAKLPPIAALAKRTGDAARGRQLLAASLKGEAQCLKCHTVQGVGGQIGPDLSTIGTKASRENLLESILLPSKAIADQFIQWRIETRTGQEVMGLLVQQGPNGVTLRDANGKDHVFAKGDIEAMTKSNVSIMPADIVKAYTEDELLDVVEYLLTLKAPPGK